VCQALRARGLRSPVLFLSAVGRWWSGTGRGTLSLARAPKHRDPEGALPYELKEFRVK
jgi:hypothetical protein